MNANMRFLDKNKSKGLMIQGYKLTLDRSRDSLTLSIFLLDNASFNWKYNSFAEFQNYSLYSTANPQRMLQTD